MKGNIDLRIARELLDSANKENYDCFSYVLRALRATDMDEQIKDNYTLTLSHIMAEVTDFIDSVECGIIEHYEKKEQTNE